MVKAGPDYNEFYVFGGLVSSPGMRSDDTRCNEMWKFNIEEEVWTLESAGTPIDP